MWARRAEKRFRAWKIVVDDLKPDSSFDGEVRDYFANQVDFVSLSRQCAQFIAEELGHMESPESCDVLVADFEMMHPRFQLIRLRKIRKPHMRRRASAILLWLC